GRESSMTWLLRLLLFVRGLYKAIWYILTYVGGMVRSRRNIRRRSCGAYWKGQRAFLYFRNKRWRSLLLLRGLRRQRPMNFVEVWRPLKRRERCLPSIKR